MNDAEPPLPFGVPGLSRRQFLQVSVTTSAATAIPTSPGQTAEPNPHPLIDTNISLGRWPFRRVPLDEPSALVARLRANGVTQAWAGSFDALVHKDIAAVNARLADECRRHAPDLLLPFGTVNLTLPDWEEDLRRCHEEHWMPGIRLHPGYHGYTLRAPAFARLLDLATARQLLVQIACSLEDERTHHPRLQVPPVDLAPLPDLLRRPRGLVPRPNDDEPSLTRSSASARGATADKPDTLSHRMGEGRGEGRFMEKTGAPRVQLLNAMRTWRAKPVLDLAAQGVRLEIATLEGVQGIANALPQIPGHCLCFGSHAPFYYFESAKLKLQESALSQAQMDAICASNADRLLNAG